MKVLIRGAGDLASGIAVRLYRSGHQVLMTEIEEPLTVRRTVAFSRAVYEKTAQVEEVEGTHVTKLSQAKECWSRGRIPVFVDEKANIRRAFQPDVVVDAILAKRNLGTKMWDAPLVIGVGPGFTAGEDCHCVVETKRGHHLGRVHYEGQAFPNTGEPGEIGGYTKERLIRATTEGYLIPSVTIGDQVEVGQVVAYVDQSPVYAQMSGMVRGMLQKGVYVTSGLKIGDIDSRCELEHCYTISDKARAIGGGVLEAMENDRHRRESYGIVLLAAGRGERFGSNKLLHKWKGKPIFSYAFDTLQSFAGLARYVVTGYKEVEEAAERSEVKFVYNGEPELGISHSIQLGLRVCLRENPDLQGVLFMVCDQPMLQRSTLHRILNQAYRGESAIVCASIDGRRGNPVYWGRKYFPELLELSGDVGGRALMDQYLEHITYVEVESAELKDVDFPEEIS